ncbi:MAG: Rap1a/Tai family immunity protein [Lamprobacter sp.]|uniref:Rap1a/Tai family immunity protein n=1 Tax=Lamprobacter sp. TaxID=3100796 RepID=UPI002B25E8C4|nr:Rap1a/Tai family immunity protein [Lamprobacter sp.]MEA3640667.1 Rap1a/Tai family immunity protein [Lamprobacter sp.]
MSPIFPAGPKAGINVVVATVLAAFAGSAAAVEAEDLRFDTTEDLYQVCAANPASPAQLACTGFIKATVQYHDGVANKRDMKRLICYPNGVTIDDGRTAFLTWAEANKGDATLMGEQPVVGLVRALAKAYPCR